MLFEFFYIGKTDNNLFMILLCEVFTMPDKDFLQLEELAKELGVTSVAIRASMKDDDLPARKIGGKWFFSRQAIHAWLGQGTWSSEKARRGADGAQDDDRAAEN